MVTAESNAGASRASRCVVLVGSRDPHVQMLFADVLGELGITLVRPPAPEAELVMAVLDRWEIDSVIAEARRAVPGAPILAVVPFDDERLCERVLSRGADACYSFTAPLAELRTALDAVTRARAVTAEIGNAG